MSMKWLVPAQIGSTRIIHVAIRQVELEEIGILLVEIPSIRSGEWEVDIIIIPLFAM